MTNNEQKSNFQFWLLSINFGDLLLIKKSVSDLLFGLVVVSLFKFQSKQVHVCVLDRQKDWSSTRPEHCKQDDLYILLQHVWDMHQGFNIIWDVFVIICAVRAYYSQSNWSYFYVMLFEMLRDNNQDWGLIYCLSIILRLLA
jgi:hypothetical protein